MLIRTMGVMTVAFCMTFLTTLISSYGHQGGESRLEVRVPTKVEAVRQYYDGHVVSVSKDKLVLQPVGGGMQRAFLLSRVFDNDGFPLNATADSQYRLSDLHNGDKVNIEYTRFSDGKEICDAICIRRRLGGRIPRSQQPLNAVDPYHERANAYQDFEEKGTPLPKQYQSPKIEIRVNSNIRFTPTLLPLPIQFW